jgi:single-stranded DNA-binding protein
MLQFTLNGRLAAEPTIHTYGTDDADMARLRVASTNPGSQNTDFFDVAVFGPAVDAVRHARKGDRVKLTGVGQQNVWQTDDGDRRENISLVSRNVLDHTPGAKGTATEHTTVAARSAASTSASPAR